MRIDIRRRPLNLGALGTVVTVLWLAALLPTEMPAQTLRWTVSESRQDYQMFDLECGRGGPCVAAVTHLLEVASIVRMTEDAGRTWRDVLTIDASSERFPLRIAQVQAVGARSLFAGFNMGVIAVSSDAGGTWEYRQAHDTGSVLVLHMKDENRGIALVEIESSSKRYAVVATDDAWRTVRQLEPPDSVLFGDTLRATMGPRVYPTGAAVLGDGTYIVVYRASTSTVALKTIDRGGTWRTQQLGSDDLRSVRFADSLNGWAYWGLTNRPWNDSLPSVLRTTDAGESWDLSLVGSRVHDLDVRGDDVIAIAREMRAYSSSDGGGTWRRDSAETLGPARMYTALPDTGDAIIVTSFGDVLLSQGRPTAVEVENQLREPAKAWINTQSGRLIVASGSLSGSMVASIYDVTGNLVGSLVGESSSSNGTAFDLDELTLAPGNYFAVVTSQGRTATTVALIHR
jgi:hypothetical protein